MRTLLFLLMITAQAASAFDIAWVRMVGLYEFESGDRSCKTTRSSNEIYLSAQLLENQPVAAGISGYTMPPNHWLSEEDLAHLSFFKGPNGHFWVDTFKLSPEILNRFVRVFHAVRCPDVTLENISGLEALTFERGGIPVGVLTSYSQTLQLRGTTRDGSGFTAKLRMMQQPHPLRGLDR